MRTLYVSDLDGTLLRSDATLSNRTKEILCTLLEKGLLFTYATARSQHSAGGLTSALPLRLPVAVYNGALLVDPQSAGILSICAGKDAAWEALIAFFIENDIAPFVYSLQEGEECLAYREIYCRHAGMRNYLDEKQGDKRLRPALSRENLFLGAIFYMTLIGGEREMLSLFSQIKGLRGLACHLIEDVYRPGEFWLEIYDASASKAGALQRLREIINAEEVVCFGDNQNDIPMFKAADRCYAVENAYPALNEIATGIISGNEADGVAEFILRDFASSFSEGGHK